LAAALGCALVWARSSWVAQPRLSRPQVADVAGRVEYVDYLVARGAVRLTIAPAGAILPPRVRISLDQKDMPSGIAPGAEIRVKARIAPPPPMALPGTYDFARDAWFQGIGGVGKTLGTLTVVMPAQPHGLDRARNGLRQHISVRLPPSSAGIAIALVTGDQNAVDKDDADAMRRSGLTHLLSVSGLHIAAVVAFAMFFSLKLLALSERLALRFNLVLVSAGVAAAAGIAVELALMPFALFHFHRSGLYGVGANIIAIPLTTFVIMPLEAAALLFDVVGWGRPLWWLCGAAIDGLLRLAHLVAGARGSVMFLPSMPGWAFGLMVAGIIWLCLWNTRLRLLGILPAAFGAAGAVLSPTPNLLVTGD